MIGIKLLLLNFVDFYSNISQAENLKDHNLLWQEGSAKSILIHMDQYDDDMMISCETA